MIQFKLIATKPPSLKLASTPLYLLLSLRLLDHSVLPDDSR